MAVIHLAPADLGTRARQQAELDRDELKDQFEIEIWEYEGERVRIAGTSQFQQLRKLKSEKTAGLAHVYGSSPGERLIRELRIPWIGEANVAPRRLWRKAADPSIAREDYLRLPESVERAYLRSTSRRPSAPRIGSVNRGERSDVMRLAMERIARFRNDVEWVEHASVPAPEDLARLGAWIDPGVDADGGSLEALVIGVPLIAARSAISMKRTLNGYAGWLVPAGDPNELAHAIVNTLFRPERVDPLVDAAVAIRDQLDPAVRASKLAAIYRRIHA